MWVFLLVLAIVPLAYYWSDSLVELLPQMAAYFPDKSVKDPQQAGNDQATPDGVTQAAPSSALQWSVNESENGVVAWLVDSKGRYRVSIGCRPKMMAAMQVTDVSGAPVATASSLKFDAGSIPLSAGTYAEGGLVPAIAQTTNLELLDSANASLGVFNVGKKSSELTARVIQQYCED